MVNGKSPAIVYGPYMRLLYVLNNLVDISLLKYMHQTMGLNYSLNGDIE